MSVNSIKQSKKGTDTQLDYCGPKKEKKRNKGTMQLKSKRINISPLMRLRPKFIKEYHLVKEPIYRNQNLVILDLSLLFSSLSLFVCLSVSLSPSLHLSLPLSLSLSLSPNNSFIFFKALLFLLVLSLSSSDSLCSSFFFFFSLHQLHVSVPFTYANDVERFNAQGFEFLKDLENK